MTGCFNNNETLDKWCEASLVFVEAFTSAQMESKKVLTCILYLTLGFLLSLLQLPNDEDPEESPQVATDAPPPYSSVGVGSSGKNCDSSRCFSGAKVICNGSVWGNYICVGLRRRNQLKHDTL